MKILVADDDPVTRTLLQRILERGGHEVTPAADGDEAWALYEAESPPLVISDWMMPGLDGIELVHRIRAAEDGAYAYVVLLTTRSGREDLLAGLEAGADDFLTKPFDANELEARIRAGARMVGLQRDLSQRNQDLRVANARMKDDLIAAARIQQALLPTEVPRFATVDFAWRLQPCSELAGDILNVFRLGAGHAGFYLLDVSGHGVPAALMSVTLSRVLVPDPPQSILLTEKESVDERSMLVPPSEVARRLNERFAAGASTGQFFTLLYGILDLRRRTVQYVSAGHPGPLLLRRGDGPVLLDATGPPIGIMPGLRYEEREVVLAPGDRLYVYSDGVTEARSPAQEQFGVDRLASFLHDHVAAPLDETLPGLLAALREWTGAAVFEDDVSCLAIASLAEDA